MTQRLHMQRDDEGFTLFELLIVIIVLAILAGIVVFSVGTSSANAATSACQTDAQAVLTAVEEYKAAVGVYPGDVSLQNPAGSPPDAQGNPTQNPYGPTPLPTYGQSWNILGYQLPGTYGLLGDVGDPNNPSATWTAPDGATVGPFLRQLPSQVHFRIVTDGEGNVYVYPPGTSGIPFEGPTMIGASVETLLGIQPPTGQQSPLLNFALDPGICSNPNIVK
jgi:prepilin-type N-terminal cleavage/methylation domain-containing protein